MQRRAVSCVGEMGWRVAKRAMMQGNYVTDPNLADLFLKTRCQRCDNIGLQLKKSKRITARHFYSEVPMSVVSSPKATSQESSQGAPKVFR